MLSLLEKKTWPEELVLTQSSSCGCRKSSQGWAPCAGSAAGCCNDRDSMESKAGHVRQGVTVWKARVNDAYKKQLEHPSYARQVSQKEKST